MPLAPLILSPFPGSQSQSLCIHLIAFRFGCPNLPELRGYGGHSRLEAVGGRLARHLQVVRVVLRGRDDVVGGPATAGSEEPRSFIREPEIETRRRRRHSVQQRRGCVGVAGRDRGGNDLAGKRQLGARGPAERVASGREAAGAAGRRDGAAAVVQERRVRHRESEPRGGSLQRGPHQCASHSRGVHHLPVHREHLRLEDRENGGMDAHQPYSQSPDSIPEGPRHIPCQSGRRLDFHQRARQRRSGRNCLWQCCYRSSWQNGKQHRRR